MLKALVTVFDDETGKVYDKDKLILPYLVWDGGLSDCYEFRFQFRILNDLTNNFVSEVETNE